MTTPYIITIDKRSANVYSASLYIPSASRPGLKHHVTIWFEVLIEEDFFGRVISKEIMIKKASCSCEGFTFRGRCRHIEEAKRIIRAKIDEMITNGQA